MRYLLRRFVYSGKAWIFVLVPLVATVVVSSRMHAARNEYWVTALVAGAVLSVVVPVTLLELYQWRLTKRGGG